jgi:hypothetical protein
MEISAEGQKPDGKKIQIIKDWPTPETLRQCRAFVATCSYFRTFIQGFAQIAAPLNKLSRKSSALVWDEKCEKSFQILKEKLGTQPVLSWPKFDGRKFILVSDASFKALGGALLQENDDTPPKENAVAFFSRGLSPTEMNIKSATVLEAISILWCLRSVKSIVFGFPIVCRTDCMSLKYLKTSKNLTERLTKLAMLLEDWKIDLEIVAGKSNVIADGLSRLDLSKVPNADIPLISLEEELLAVSD